MRTRDQATDWTPMDSENPARTPLYPLHARLGAKFVPFAGYEMPVQYPTGVLAEHLHTRHKAGLFDVSHMGQIRLSGPGAAEELENLVPGDIAGLGLGRMRYTQFTNEDGGILDDLMVTNCGDDLMLVVNAGTKQDDLTHLREHLSGEIEIYSLRTRALLALQGPEAVSVMARLAPELATLPFMSATVVILAGASCLVTRSGYTGEDGFEISVADEYAVTLAEELLSHEEVAPIGLGARDSLRLEAGLCLYGHDIGVTTSPIEAGLAWSIGKRRRNEGGFLGADVILRELDRGPSRRRVGILPETKAPAREHTEITDGERIIGTVTSGGFGPTVGGPIAMGYVAADCAAPGTQVQLLVRDTPRPAHIVPLPFTPARFYRG